MASPEISPGRCEQAEQVMRSFGVDDEWVEKIDPGSPEWVVEWVREVVAAYRDGDVGWLLGHTDPEIEVTQPPEVPDAASYRGPAAQIDAILDWPLEWDDFRVEPRRIYPLDDGRVVVIAIHRGRSRTMGVDVEAEVVWLFTLRDRSVLRWDMFMSHAAALEAANAG